MANHAEETHLEKWLLSKLQKRIAIVTASLEELKTRTALEIALFETWNDFRWYMQRKGNLDAKALLSALEVWMKMLAPFAPYVCEEVWSRMGKTSFISTAEWSRFDKSKVDAFAEEKENILTDLIEDTLNVLKATKITPKRICYYIAATWKRKVHSKILAKVLKSEVKVNEVMKELAKDSALKSNMQAVAKFVPKAVKMLNRLPNDRKSRISQVELANEKEIIEKATFFLKSRFNAQIDVYSEEDETRYDPKQRATIAMPYQPAIYVE